MIDRIFNSLSGLLVAGNQVDQAIHNLANISTTDADHILPGFQHGQTAIR